LASAPEFLIDGPAKAATTIALTHGAGITGHPWSMVELLENAGV
jgi:hypothetical protein